MLETKTDGVSATTDGVSCCGGATGVTNEKTEAVLVQAKASASETGTITTEVGTETLLGTNDGTGTS